MKIWKLTLWKVSDVNDTLGHNLLKSLAAKDLWERESLRFIPRKTTFVHATNNIDVLILVLRISFSARLGLAHTAYFNWSLQTSHRTLLASPSSNIFFGDNNRGRGNNNLNSWFIVHLGRIDLRREDDTVFGHTLRIASKNAANKLLHGGFIISFMKFINILIFIKTDLSASIDVIISSSYFQGYIEEKKLKFSSFSKLIPWFVYKLSIAVIPPNTRVKQLEWYRGNFKASPAWRRMPTDFLFKSSLFKIASLISAAQTLSLIPSFLQNSKQIIIMNISLYSCSTESDVFYVEQTPTEGSPIRNNTPAILNSTEMSGAMEREVITISSVASREPRIVTLDSDSNDPTMPYGFGNQQPIVPPKLNDLNLPPNPFNVLATMAVIRVDDEYSPQSREPTIPSPISKPPMNVSTIEGWDTTHTTTDDATFCTDDELRKVYWDISSSDTFDSNEPRNVSVASSLSSTPPPPPQQKRRLSMETSFPQKGGVSQHTCEACGQPLLQGNPPIAYKKLKTLTELSI